MTSPMVAIKKVLERKDGITPGGGRMVTAEELKTLKQAVSPDEWANLGREACALLGLDESASEGVVDDDEERSS